MSQLKGGLPTGLRRASEDEPRPGPGDRAPPPVRLAGLGLAVPPHELSQLQARRTAERIFGGRWPDFARLATSFETSGVERRYSVAPLDWFETPRTWPERTALYLESATALFVEAARNALADGGLAASDIDTVVTISSTGIATPTLEARAFEAMGFRSDLHRVPVFGLGCAGGVSGMAIAARLARAMPGSNVLMVSIETCTLNFRDDRLSKADVIASVLFGDGAAAACLTTGGGASAPAIGEGEEHLWPDTLGIMGWDVDAAGFGVIFDRSIPSFVEAHFRDAAAACLARADLCPEDIARFVCHPGGAKVVETIELTMGFEPGLLDHERGVLRDYGNMSAPTALFVLKRVMDEGRSGQMALAALGPGFTVSLLPILLPG